MIPALVLTLLVVAYRIVVGITGSSEMQWLHNFSPLAAVALCGAIYFPRRLAAWGPAVALLVSDLALNAHYGTSLLTVEMLPRYAAIAAIVALGLMIRRSPNVGRTLGASVVGSIFFYLVTNTGSWLAEPRYAKSLAGWVQALTTGLQVPGFPTTIEFFRNTLVSDLLFTGAFLLCVSLSRSKASEAVETGQTQAA